jgi:hypothetical protein
MKGKFYILAIILTGLTLGTAVFADVKIKSKQTSGGQGYENTTYIKGKRQRTESMGGMMVGITQCDLRRSIQITPSTQTYIVTMFDEPATTSTQTTTSTRASNGPTRAGGTITSTVTIKDTGERKQMFGFTARHLIITTEMVSSPDACNKTDMKMQTDGWYIDAEFALDCDLGFSGGYSPKSSASGGCRDRYVMKQVGAGKRGYPVYEKMTTFDASGKETFSTVSEVLEISRATLDPALFEAPAGYREVSSAAEMYSAGAFANSQKEQSTPSRTEQAVRSAAQTAPSSATQLGPKKPGVVRVGLARVKTGAVGDAIDANDLAAAVRNSLSESLQAPNIEVVALDAESPSAIDAELKKKECDYVVYSTVTHKKGGGGFGGFGSVISSAIANTPIGSTGSTAGNVAVAVARDTAITANDVATDIKSKDEISLDLKVQQASGSVVLSKQFKAKAKSDGDNVISQVTASGASAVAQSLGK